ncbi:MAG: LytTR family DNA-binding domain-containing protein [Lachnospiraceae bacterium]
MTIRIGIIEDETTYIQQLIQILNQWSDVTQCQIENHIYTCEKELLWVDIVRYDLLFLDIKLGNDDGILIAKKLRKKKYEGAIIFLTAYKEYVFDGYYVHAFNYLLKPITLEKLSPCMDELAQTLSDQYYVYCSKGNIIKIPYAKIYIFSSNRHYIDIITKDTTYQQLHLFRDLIAELPSCFIQCHRSTIINIQQVTKIEKNTLFFTNQSAVPISKTYYAAVCNAYINYAKGKSSL